ncbi:XTP/dITP diphosphohydrolase [Desulfotomaculum arcticum]|uniref:XTP/dITP diphosphohydrolase n=1 Tax=Desulfotruncus arcticus DSM 17038 TaxID=1121424 RepID=A0A1I2TAT7_9FIRM|nr:XTP/dITP diphosphohydrolase [Desulfotomaculum arcticum] [Desulfotruncus arcticus DSM 17038]
MDLLHKPMRFVTSNQLKINEYELLLDPFRFIPVRLNMREPQGDDQREIVRSKVLIAFSEKRAPLFVDHTGLSIQVYNDLPGGMTPEIWSRLGVEGFLRLMQCETNRKAVVRTIIGYCCGKRIHIFEAKLQGEIAGEPQGPAGTWECLFIPDGYDTSLAALPVEKKNKISARGQAAQQFKKFLTRQAVKLW